MSNNLIVSYDLNVEGQNYTAVSEKIKSLGGWAHIQKSVWYLKSALSCQQAAQSIYQSMDSNDSLIVIDASNNQASWYGLDDSVGEYIKGSWLR